MWVPLSLGEGTSEHEWFQRALNWAPVIIFSFQELSLVSPSGKGMS